MSFGAARLVCGSLTVEIGHHQWEFADERMYLARSLGETPYGVSPRQTYGVTVSRRTVRFVKIESLMDQLRRLSYYAGLGARAVTFYPDITDLTQVWTVDWPPAVEFERIVENREAIALTLQRQV